MPSNDISPARIGWTFYFSPLTLRFLDALPLGSAALSRAALFPRDFAGFASWPSSSTSPAAALAAAVFLRHDFASFGCLLLSPVSAASSVVLVSAFCCKRLLLRDGVGSSGLGRGTATCGAGAPGHCCGLGARASDVPARAGWFVSEGRSGSRLVCVSWKGDPASLRAAGTGVG